MATESRTVVLAALSGNLAIAVTKFAAFFLTRSHSMLTEGVHSLVDTGDQFLMLIGQKRGARPPDESHPFGYGMETYFWSFIVALMIFVIGGVVSVWQGTDKFLHPEPVARPWINYLVLGLSALFEGGSFLVGYRQYRRMVRGRRVRLLQFLRISKDPTLFATLLEDGAALIGLSLAGLGVLGTEFGLPWADGAASIAIGCLLLAIAVFLANESRSLIAGESAAGPIAENLRQALRDPNVLELKTFATLHLGPDQILVTADLKFRPGLSGEAQTQMAAILGDRLRAADPRVKSVYLQPA